MDYPIEIIREKISRGQLENIVKKGFGEMVKVVVDIKRKILAIGGELHADEEAVLIKDGSNPEDLWGANIYLSKPKVKIDFGALINIRPSRGNRSMEIQDRKIKEKVKTIIDNLIE